MKYSITFGDSVCPTQKKINYICDVIHIIVCIIYIKVTASVNAYTEKNTLGSMVSIFIKALKGSVMDEFSQVLVMSSH